MIVDQVNELWNAVLDFLNKLVVPDWGALVGLLPVFLVVGVIGPVVTLTTVFWLRYEILKPRVRTEYADLRRPAPLDADGNPVFPTGEPYSLSEGMIYEAGATLSDTGEDLLVACPKCGLVRAAAVETCGNCGLSFSLKQPTRVLRSASAPPGGRSAA